MTDFNIFLNVCLTFKSRKKIFLAIAYILKSMTAVKWLKYCRYGVKKTIQSINQDYDGLCLNTFERHQVLIKSFTFGFWSGIYEFWVARQHLVCLKHNVLFLFDNRRDSCLMLSFDDQTIDICIFLQNKVNI